MNSSPFSITLNLLLAAEASDSESVVKSLFETYEKKSDFFFYCPEHIFFLFFLPVSSDSEFEDVLSSFS